MSMPNQAAIIAAAEQKLGEALLPRLVQSLWQLPCGFVDAGLKVLAAKPAGPKDTAGFVPATTGDSLLQLCCTACQQKALWTFLEAINGMANSSCQRVLSLTGRRGRGKSSVAALGMVALLQRRISVVVTGPGSNSIQGMFRFAADVLKEAQPEHVQLRSLMSGRARFLEAETVPGYVTALSCVDDAPVLIVDEMASLAIPTLHQLLSSRAPLVLLLGTLSGAEGTGAAVQEKVFKELGADSAEACHHATLPPGVSKRQFVKLSLQEAVRYKPGDPVESWLDSLLFLDMPSPPTDPKAYGTVGAARLMEIDTGSSNPLLASVMGLLRGHYRTSPNDLARLVSDAHIRTFALVANGGQGPPAVAVVAIEETPERLGKGTAKVHQTHLLAHGVEKEYPHLALARLSGLRPWRVVAAPALRGRGFGQKALELLEAHARDAFTTGCSAARFDWLGVSFGLTAQLFRFWSRAGYRPVVMSNTPNDQTGEMSIKMLLPISAALQRALPAIMPLFGTSFYRRLPTCFRHLDPMLVVEILALCPAANSGTWQASSLEASKLEKLATARKPVEEVARNYDVFACLASAYFFGCLAGLRFSKTEEAALCAIGGQMLSLAEAAERLGRGAQPGDRQNDVAARLRTVAKEISLHIGALDVECLLTIAPREQVLLERSQAHCVAQLWLPPLLELRGEVHIHLPKPYDTDFDHDLAELANYAIHDLHVQEPHFSMLVSGVKRFEVRMAKRRFNCIEARSYFRLQRASPPQTAMLKILRVSHYGSVEEALTIEGVDKILPGTTTLAAGLSTFQQLYGASDMSQGVVVFELEPTEKGAQARRATTLPILHSTASVSTKQKVQEQLRVQAEWRYPTSAKGCGELKLEARWDTFLGEVRPSWCLEATAFCVLGEQTCSLPFDEELEFVLDLGDAKPRWSQVKVCFTVWDEVVLRTARNAFFGQTWLPSLTELGG
ncbi:unnamed protein product [Durusdinium trenchii]|uniref:N-acetyltransferase domain-containing protein n=1 Tax=Durusdinium trenchii TaxID=1381693 RepID=A0ABP0QY05_9DINO